MGTGPVPLKVNSRGKRNLECIDEMHAFMQCFAVRATAAVVQIIAARLNVVSSPFSPFCNLTCMGAACCSVPAPMVTPNVPIFDRRWTAVLLLL